MRHRRVQKRVYKRQIRVLLSSAVVRRFPIALGSVQNGGQVCEKMSRGESASAHLYHASSVRVLFGCWRVCLCAPTLTRCVRSLVGVAI
jgi:hypothetical protein